MEHPNEFDPKAPCQDSEGYEYACFADLVRGKKADSDLNWFLDSERLRQAHHDYRQIYAGFFKEARETGAWSWYHDEVGSGCHILAVSLTASCIEGLVPRPKSTGYSGGNGRPRAVAAPPAEVHSADEPEVHGGLGPRGHLQAP